MQTAEQVTALQPEWLVLCFAKHWGCAGWHLPAGAVTPHQNPCSERFTKPRAPAEEFVVPWAGRSALILTSALCGQPHGEG